MPFQIINGDLIAMKTEAIVNAANSSLAMGGGVCGAIFRAAGPAEMTKACQAIGHCPTGQAVITPGFGLAAKYVIHAVGPVWRGGQNGEPELLASCYQNSLNLALANNCQSIAFPLISAGIYGYPKDLALQVAEKSVTTFFAKDPKAELSSCLTVFLVLRSQNLTS
ncbi:MAG: macro domain-containing protein [Deltaproteobacteria bacterium]|jgi:O-acetyl-ADP-ribose deacetylase (regulator of RNase III)|nr:macro domain-containing protein [Deltaproteobacteria bacterium]